MSTALSAPQSPLVPQQQTLSDDWKQEITERLDRYRAHRPRSAAQAPSPARTHAESRTTEIARAVASRYAAAPTYSELIAAATQATQAEEAARAQALAEEEERIQQQAAQATLFEAAEQARQESSSAEYGQLSPSSSGNSNGGEQAFMQRYGSAIVTQALQPAVPGRAVMPEFAARNREMHLHQAQPEPEPSLEDLLASSLVESRAMLPSKLIEFPRELISPRRARPRSPENASREQELSFQEQQPAQLRIFEVQQPAEVRPEAESEMNAATAPVDEKAAVANPANAGEPAAKATMSLLEMAAEAELQADTITGATTVESRERSATSSKEPVSQAVKTADESPNRGLPNGGTESKSTRAAASSASTAPVPAFRGLEWASISLDKEPAAYSRRAESGLTDFAPFMVDPASIDRRVMAFAVDFAAVTAGFLAFLVVFVASTPHLPHGLTALVLSTVVYGALWVLYQMLFFSLSGATAGMLYAHIALCTFEDQNPSRSALQRRLGAWWISLLPVGIGFLWCFVDEDNLCWHDRITRTYQREY